MIDPTLIPAASCTIYADGDTDDEYLVIAWRLTATSIDAIGIDGVLPRGPQKVIRVYNAGQDDYASFPYDNKRRIAL